MTSKNMALVIEDDVDLSEIFAQALQTAGFEVEAIRDGLVAQTRLKETSPHVIVLDLHLPHVDGGTLLEQIHSTDALRHANIIITTADNVLAEMYRDRATIVMVKPISFAQLRDISARLKD